MEPSFLGMSDDNGEVTHEPQLVWSMRRIRRLLIIAAYAAALGLITVIATVILTWSRAPSAEHALVSQQKIDIVFTDRHDQRFAVRRNSVSTTAQIERLPAYLLDAIVAAVDPRFFDHGGVTFSSATNAIFNQAHADGPALGDKTVSQELALILLPQDLRGWRRSLHELALARKLEDRFTKLEILELYANRAYFGAGAWGVEQAAQTYFNKAVDQLTLGEAAYLASVARRYRPGSSFGVLVNPSDRAAQVLNHMLSHGDITEPAWRAASGTPVELRRSPDLELTGHFVDWTLAQLAQLDWLANGQIVVRTTLDLDMQHAAQRAVDHHIPLSLAEQAKVNAAFAAIDGRGGIRAMVDRSLYLTSTAKPAVTLPRQPGSAFLPVVYAAALQAGVDPQSQWIDQPIVVDGWAPKNSSDQYYGQMSLAAAIVYSINTIAVQVSENIGRDAILAMAQAMGMRSPMGAAPWVAMGVYPVTPLELAGLYAPLANEGFAVTPYAIESISDSQGRTLFRADSATPPRVLSRTITARINHALGASSDRAAGLAQPDSGRALIGHWSGGKIGVTPARRDAWYAGYTPGLVGVAWIGLRDDADQNAILETGAPVSVWKTFMSEALDGVTPPTPLLPTR